MGLAGWLVVLVTAPRREAKNIAEKIIADRLAACVNIVDKIESIYWWKGSVEHGEESLLIIKTRTERFPELVEKIKEIHSYTVPEIIALPIIMGNEDYLAWVDAETRREKTE